MTIGIVMGFGWPENFGKKFVKKRDGIFKNPVRISVANFFWLEKPVRISVANFFLARKTRHSLLPNYFGSENPSHILIDIPGNVRF